MTSVAVVDGGGAVVEYISNVESLQQEECVSEEDGYPAVVVESLPCSHLEQYYAAQVVVYGDEAYLMPDVAEEHVVETEVLETGAVELVEASVQSNDEHCSDKTIEAAEALLHMDSPTSLREDRSPGTVEELASPCMTTPDFIHAAMRPDVDETVVEVCTEDSEPMEMVTVLEDSESEPIKKKKAGRKAKIHNTLVSTNTPDLGVKKRSREGKGSTTYLWEFLLDLLQDKSTCPRYIKWTQREKGIFKLVDSKAVSKLWGKHKNKPDMNYETMGRALRYYYQRGILAKVEGQRLVYQFKEMPKNIVFIDDDKSDPSEEELLGNSKSYERIPPSSETLLHSPELAKASPTILRGNIRAKSMLSGTSLSQIVTVSSEAARQQTVAGARTVQVAMQVPVVMTTTLGQKLSTVTMQPSSSPILTSASGGGASAPKVVIQTIPTMVPARGENGEKITVQLAKIITIPASQLAHCQTAKSVSGVSLLGSPLAVRALSATSVAPGTQVVRIHQSQIPSTTLKQPETNRLVTVTVSDAGKTETTLC